MEKPILLSHRRIGLGSYASSDTVSRDGEIFIPVMCDAPYALYSGDNGSTWQTRQLAPDANHSCRFVQLKNGKFISFAFDNQVHEKIINTNQSKIPFILAVHRADNMSEIMENKFETDFVSVDIPQLSFGYGDSGNSHTGTVDHGVVELENGDIIITMYGQRKTDTTVCPYFDENCGYRFYLYSSWCLISHDGGKSFSYLSSIADVQTYPIADVNAEGYCEPDIISLGGGHIVSVIRTGGHEVYSPLYCAHSYDDGKSWDAPYEICDWGVFPKLLKMSDGRLVCISGHIHTMLLFSFDEGKTWSKPFIAEECDGKWGKSPSGYNSAIESAPGELTIVYDDPKEGIAEGGEEGKVRNIYIRKYKIF